MSESSLAQTKPLAVITKTQQQEIAKLVAPADIVPVISTQDEYTAAGQKLIALSANLKSLEAIRTGITGPLNQALDKLNEFFNPHKAKIKAGIEATKTAMSAYLTAENAKRAAAQKLLDDAAAAERARVQKLADAAAQKARDEAAEAARVAAKKRQEESVALAAGNAAKAAAAAAAAAKSEAKVEQIEVKASVAADIAAVKIASLEAPRITTPRVSTAGVGTRKVWTYELIKLDEVPRDYLMLCDEAVKTAIAAGVRDIPGVRIFEKEGIVLSARKAS